MKEEKPLAEGSAMKEEKPLAEGSAMKEEKPSALCLAQSFASCTFGEKMSGDFYVVLPSNTKTDIFQDNKTNDYEISLPRAMEFGGTTYEVALCEIHFPHTWLNIKPPMLGVTFTALENEKMWGERRVEYHRKIDEGYYETVEDLLEVSRTH